MKVSLVIPVCDTLPSLLLRSLRSIGDQRQGLAGVSLQVVIVDDASIAGATIDAVERGASYFPGCLVVRNSARMGLAYSRAVGVVRSSGDYIFFLDSDDVLPPFAIQRLTHLALRTGADVIDGYVRRIEGNNARWQRSLNNESLEEQLRKTLRAETSFMMPGSLYSSTVLARSELRIPHRFPHEDMTTRVRALLSATSYEQVSACTYRYHIRKGSLSSFSGLRNLEGYLAATVDWLATAEKKGLLEDYEMDISVGARKLLRNIVKRINQEGVLKGEDRQLIAERLLNHSIPQRFFSVEELAALSSAVLPND